MKPLSLERLAGTTVVKTGRVAQGSTLDIPATSPLWLWLTEGRARRMDSRSREREAIRAPEIYPVDSSVRLECLEDCTYVLLEPGKDPLGFGERVHGYHVMMEERNRAVGKALAQGLTLRGGQIWVDVGTGTGAMVEALRETAQEPLWVFGVDQARRMIQHAWERQDPSFSAWYIERDVLRLPWPTAMLDGVTALLVLHLVEDIDPLLHRIFRALKPGGTFAYAVSADGNPFVRMIMRQLNGPGDFFQRGQKRIHDALLRTGFQIGATAVYRDEIRVDSPEAMRALIQSIGGPASRGLRDDVSPPPVVERVFDLVWAFKPGSF